MAPHYQDSSITIHKIKCGPYDNNAYRVVSPKPNESIIIDTPADPGPLISAARARKGRPMAERLSQELLEASRGQGSAVRRREDLYRMAEANRAFAHYRW